MPKELPAVTVLSTQRKLTDMVVHIDPASRAINVRFNLSSVRRFSDGTVNVQPDCSVVATTAQIVGILTPELHAAVSALAHQLADGQG